MQFCDGALISHGDLGSEARRQSHHLVKGLQGREVPILRPIHIREIDKITHAEARELIKICGVEPLARKTEDDISAEDERYEYYRKPFWLQTEADSDEVVDTRVRGEQLSAVQDLSLSLLAEQFENALRVGGGSRLQAITIQESQRVEDGGALFRLHARATGGDADPAEGVLRSLRAALSGDQNRERWVRRALVGEMRS
ncbi:MAG: hypothetical protein JW395_1894 [Nitrospira sp.]|nr:hypothetical protein [Nitrospira sp.]